MLLEKEVETGKVSCQFPDVWCSLYPAGSKSEDGIATYYRGALVIRRGLESVHLNALDVGDVEMFLADPYVHDVRQRMTKEHVATNMLRALVLESKLGGMSVSNNNSI